MRFRTAAIAAGCIGMLCAAPATAAADTETAVVAETAASLQTCQDPAVGPLLARFGDLRSYFLAPGGDFESGADGWTLEGGASVVGGSSALDVVGGSMSLRLPAGASAMSPSFCVDERYPTFRMTTAQLGTVKAEVEVQMVYPDLARNVRRTGRLTPKRGAAWGLTDDMKIKPSHGVKVGGWRKVALRFQVSKAAEGSDLRVDDVVIDPRMR